MNDKRNKFGFKRYLENHTLTYKDHKDFFSLKIRRAVNLLYGHEWNKRLKPLLGVFTIYVNWNLGTYDLDEEEVTFLVYQYLRYVATGSDIRNKYNSLKKYLLEEIDEDDLEHWLTIYPEMRTHLFKFKSNFEFYKKKWLSDKISDNGELKTLSEKLSHNGELKIWPKSKKE